MTISVVHLKAKPDPRTPIARLKALVKDAGRRQGLQCPDMPELSADGPNPVIDAPDSGNRPPTFAPVASERIGPTFDPSEESTRQNDSTAAGESKPVEKNRMMILASSEVWAILTMMTLTDDIRKAVETCGMTRYRISQETGIPQSVLSRFVAGDMARSDTLDKLADLLGLQVTHRRKRRTSKGR